MTCKIILMLVYLSQRGRAGYVLVEVSDFAACPLPNLCSVGWVVDQLAPLPNLYFGTGHFYFDTASAVWGIR